ncbi:MAG: DUF3667 domain-containing protein [Gemmatimonadota bacterium]|nr:DUF3667 domain-containing protein [Gemmatimonadota bacterium]
MATRPSATARTGFHTEASFGLATACLNCGSPLTGAYCAECGQRAVDLAAPIWLVLKEAMTDAIDVDGRAFRTARALGAPGRLTTEFLSGRRAPYLGPVKLFLLAGTLLTTTWIVTRGIDSHYYHLSVDSAAGAYIDRVVRGSLAAGMAIAVSSWLLALGRRRFMDDVVFALHLVATLTLWATAVIWIGTAWKIMWGTAAATPPRLPALPFLLFLPAAVVGCAYIGSSVRRVYGGPWWAMALRTLLITAAGIAAVIAIISHTV